MTLEISDCTPSNELQALNRKFEFSHASKHSFHSDLTKLLSRQKNNKTGRFKPPDCVVKECSLFFQMWNMKTPLVRERSDWCRYFWAIFCQLQRIAALFLSWKLCDRLSQSRGYHPPGLQYIGNKPLTWSLSACLLP